MNIELKPIAESKIRQLGGDVCGVLVRKGEKLAAVDEHGRVQWLQSGQGAEPVALLRREIGESSWFDHAPVRPNTKEAEWLKVSPIMDHCEVYTQPQPAQQGSVPEGWKLVPVEPTPEMREEFFKAQEECEDFEGVYGPEMPDHQWRAMLSAAPQPPKEGAGDE